MKILQLSKLYPPFFGGIETVVYDISTDLNQYDDYEVDVLCVSETNSSSDEIVEGVRVYRKSSFAHIASTYLSISYIYTWLKRKNDYDVVHVHLPNPLANLALFLFRPKCKVVLHWHSDVIKQRILKKLLFPLQNWMLKRSDVIITTSPSYGEHSEDLNRFKKKIVVVPIGINSPTTNSDVLANKVNSIKEMYRGKKIIFALGRHVYYKGFSFLIDSLQYLPNEYILLLGGKGELSESLETQVAEKSLQKRVFFLGRIPNDDLPSYYAACDVFCLPSIEKSEAFGVVQLEAMAHGKPVVSTNITGSGVSWVNKHGTSGIVCRIKDSQEIANSILKANGSFSSSEIINYFEKNFTKEVMNKKIMNIYKDYL